MKKILVIALMLVSLIFAVVACDPQSSVDNKGSITKSDGDKKGPFIEWNIEGNSFVGNIDKTFETPRGTMDIEKEIVLTFSNADGEITPNEGDLPFGENGIIALATSYTHSETSHHIMTGNEGNVVDKTEDLDLTINFTENNPENLVYSVSGDFDSDFSSNFDLPGPGMSGKHMLWPLLRCLPGRRQFPESGIINLNINIDNNGNAEEKVGTIVFDGDSTALLTINGEETEINLNKPHNGGHHGNHNGGCPNNGGNDGNCDGTGPNNGGNDGNCDGTGPNNGGNCDGDCPNNDGNCDGDCPNNDGNCDGDCPNNDGNCDGDCPNNGGNDGNCDGTGPNNGGGHHGNGGPHNN